MVVILQDAGWAWALRSRAVGKAECHFTSCSCVVTDH